MIGMLLGVHMSSVISRIRSLAAANNVKPATIDDIERWRQEGIQEAAIQRRANRYEWLKRQSGMSNHHQHCNFDNYVATNAQQQSVVTACKQYCDNYHLARNLGFLMFGNTGTGKNHLASAIANDLINKGYRVLIMSVDAYMRMIRSTWERDSRVSESQVFKRLLDVDLLILDEVGLQRGTDDELIQLTRLMDARLYAYKATAVIGNFDNPEGFKPWLGVRGYERLKEGAAFAGHFGWESYRRVGSLTMTQGVA